MSDKEKKDEGCCGNKKDACDCDEEKKKNGNSKDGCNHGGCPHGKGCGDK